MNLKSYLEMLMDGHAESFWGGRSTIRQVENLKEFKLITGNGKKSLRGVITADGKLYMFTEQDKIMHTDLVYWLVDRKILNGVKNYYNDNKGEWLRSSLSEFLTVISVGNVLKIGEANVLRTYEESPKKVKLLLDSYQSAMAKIGITLVKEHTGLVY